MPKRYTDAEVTKIVQESQELREYVKAMTTNFGNYTEEMKTLRERNAELEILVKDSQIKMMEDNVNFMTDINKAVSTMASDVASVKPDIDTIKNEARSIRNNRLEPANSMWLLNMLMQSAPEYIRDLMMILERGERRGSRDFRRDNVLRGMREADFNYAPVPDFTRLFEKPIVTAKDITSMAESLQNLSADDVKINADFAEESEKPKPRNLKSALEELKEPLNIITPPKESKNKKK